MTDFNLPHIYWIGGSPCGGKSTVAQIIADQYHLNLYRIDDHIDRLMQHISPEAQPALCQWQSQTWEERWMQTVDVLLEFVLQAYDEEFQLCMQEINNIPSTRPTVVEGNPLRPELVSPYLKDPHHAIWLIADEEDLRYFYRQRVWAQQVVKECTDPQQAFEHWMKRDIAFANQIRSACITHQLPYLMSDRQLSLEVKAKKVASHFQLGCVL
ncbi:MAG: hypothetical protein V2J07_09905 [Anaerolineae bacterium]|jgi:2-phosphoglycerate kinase|nr:hypothetical protein [Anaerolineae bacterium]